MQLLSGGRLQIVIGAGRFAQQNWWVLAVAVIVIGYWWRWQMRRASSRFKWDGRFLKLPIFGDLINKIETARFVADHLEAMRDDRAARK